MASIHADSALKQTHELPEKHDQFTQTNALPQRRVAVVGDSPTLLSSLLDADESMGGGVDSTLKKENQLASSVGSVSSREREVSTSLDLSRDGAGLLDIATSSAQPVMERRKSTHDDDEDESKRSLPTSIIPTSVVTEVLTSSPPSVKEVGIDTADLLADEQPSLRDYISSRIQNIKDEFKSLSSDSGVSNILSSCDDLERHLIEELNSLESGPAAESISVSGSGLSDTEVEPASVSGSELANPDLSQRKGVFERYVKTVFPERNRPSDPWIACPGTVLLANQAYIKAQPPLRTGEMWGRIGWLTLKVAAAALLLGGAAVASVMSAGIFPAVVLSTTAAVAGLATMAGIGGVVGLVHGAATFFSTKKTGFSTEQKKAARQVGSETFELSRRIACSG